MRSRAFALAQRLQERHGGSFDYPNVTRMLKFAARFPEHQIVVPLAQQLGWSHIIALLPIESDEAFMFCADDASRRQLGKRGLRHQIDRKALPSKGTQKRFDYFCEPKGDVDE